VDTIADTLQTRALLVNDFEENCTKIPPDTLVFARGFSASAANSTIFSRALFALRIHAHSAFPEVCKTVYCF
jgi:hypothetical protein